MREILQHGSLARQLAFVANLGLAYNIVMTVAVSRQRE